MNFLIVKGLLIGIEMSNPEILSFTSQNDVKSDLLARFAKENMK